MIITPENSEAWGALFAKFLNRLYNLYPGLTDDDLSAALPWAEQHEPALYAHEITTGDAIDWSIEVSEFKKRAVAYLKTLLAVFGKYHAHKEKHKAPEPQEAVHRPHTFKPAEPEQGRLL